MRSRFLAVMAGALAGCGVLGAGALHAQVTRSSWVSLGPASVPGPIRVLAADPSTPSRLFAGSEGGGLWRTTDLGATWSPVDDYFPSLVVTSILFKPGSSSTLFVATERGGVILRSDDAGATWTPIGPPEPGAFNSVRGLAMSMDGAVLLAATDAGLYRTINAGASWTRVIQGHVTDVKFVPGNPTRAIATSPSVSSGTYHSSNAYYSTDSGATWSATPLVTSSLNSQFVNLRTVRTAMSAAASNIVYIAAEYFYFAGLLPGEQGIVVFKSTDGGQTFSEAARPTSVSNREPKPGVAVWVDPTDVNVVVVGSDYLHRSSDGGTSWTALGSAPVAPDAPQQGSYAIINDSGYNGTTNRRVYVGTEAGVYRTSDVRGATGPGSFSAINHGLAAARFYSGAGHAPSGIIIGTTPSGTLRSSPAGGGTWTRIGDSRGRSSAIDPQDPRYLYALEDTRGFFQGKIYVRPPFRVSRSADGGATWDCLQFNDGIDSRMSFQLDPNVPTTMFGVGVSLYRTQDLRTPTTGPCTGGPIWTRVLSDWSGGGVVAVAQGDSDVVWHAAEEQGPLSMTTNGTAATPTWTRVGASLPARQITGVTIDPANHSVVYVTYDSWTSGNIWKTTDSGATWEAASGSGSMELPALPVYSLAIHPQNQQLLYAGTARGVFTSRDAGVTWNTQSSGPAHVEVVDLFWMSTDLVAVTAGRGVFRTPTTELVMNLDDPVNGSAITTPFTVRGWALDRTAATGTGVDTIHVYAHGQSGAAFLGEASRVDRPDVGAVFGSRFTPSGFELTVGSLAPGVYVIAAYARSTVSGSFAAARAATVTVAPPPSTPLGWIDAPAAATVPGSFTVEGWGIDAGAAHGVGVDAVHVYAFPSGSSPFFLGVAASGAARPDIGALFGARFTNSGYSLAVTGLPPGSYQLVVYMRSTVSGAFFSRARSITVRPPGDPLMWIDVPATGASVGTAFEVIGWAIDRDAPTGTGVDALHVWAFPVSGGSPVFVGVAAYGQGRSDVGAAFGAQFTNSGYNLTVTSLAPGEYDVVAYARSTVTGGFNQWRVVRVNAGP